MKPGAVIVIVIFVPTGIFFLANGLRRLSLARAPDVVKRLLLYGQPFFCCFFFFVLQVTVTVAPLGRFLTARFRSFVYFLNPSELMLAVDGSGGDDRRRRAATATAAATPGRRAAPIEIVRVVSLELPTLSRAVTVTV